MGKLSVRSAIAAPKFEIQDEVLDFFDEKEDERHAYELERDESWLYWQQYSQPRNFTLTFYNFMVGGGDAVIDIYRRFDHVLMTWEQAKSTMLDVVDELADLIEANDNEVGNVYESGSNTVEVSFCVYDDEFREYHWYTAYVSAIPVDEIDDVAPRKVDVIDDDRFWLSANELRKKELVGEIHELSETIETLRKIHEHTWSGWVKLVKEGRAHVASFAGFLQDPEWYLENERKEAQESALNALHKLETAEEKLRLLKRELKELS